MKVFFSVIIPALNEEFFLPKLLNSIKEQKFSNFEVILIDANSTDKTVEKAKKYKKNLKLKILHTKEKNISHSRNLGAQKAIGKYLVFIDSDNYIQPDFLQEVNTLLQKKNYDMIVPALEPDSGKIIHRASYFTVNKLVKLGKYVKLYFSTGGNLIVSKPAFEKLKGFDETLFVGEDHDFVDRASKKGLKVKFLTDSKIIFSTRRLEKEGAAMLAKYAVSTVYIAFFGKITKRIYNYEMGGEQYGNKS